MAADYRRQTRTKTRHEYVLDSPATGKDIQQVIHHALNDMPADRRSFDDAYHVESHDEEIIVWWSEEKTEDVW